MTAREEMAELRKNPVVARYLYLAASVAGSGCSAKKAVACRAQALRNNAKRKAKKK